MIIHSIVGYINIHNNKNTYALDSSYATNKRPETKLIEFVWWLNVIVILKST